MCIKINLLLVLFLSTFCAEVVSNDAYRFDTIASNHTQTGDIWMESVMLRHTLFWRPPEGSTEQTFTVKYRVNDIRSRRNIYHEVVGCTGIARKTCDLTAALKQVALHYIIQVTSTSNKSEVLWQRSMDNEFCPEYDTTLITPDFTALRLNNAIVLHPQKPLNRGNNKSISAVLGVIYQVKYWKDTVEKKENEPKYLFKAPLGTNEEDIIDILGVDKYSGYCVMLRLYHDILIAPEPVTSLWSEKLCLSADKKPINQTGIAFGIAAVFATVLIFTFVLRLSYKVWSICKTPKTPPKILGEALKGRSNFMKPIKTFEHVDLLLPRKPLSDHHAMGFNCNWEKYQENEPNCESTSVAAAAAASSSSPEADDHDEDDERSKMRYHSASTNEVDKANDDDINHRHHQQQPSTSSPYSPHFTTVETDQLQWVSDGDSPYSSVFYQSSDVASLYKSPLRMLDSNDDDAYDVTKAQQQQQQQSMVYRMFWLDDALGEETTTDRQRFSHASSRTDWSPEESSSSSLHAVSSCSLSSDAFA